MRFNPLSAAVMTSFALTGCSAHVVGVKQEVPKVDVKPSVTPISVLECRYKQRDLTLGWQDRNYWCDRPGDPVRFSYHTEHRAFHERVLLPIPPRHIEGKISQPRDNLKSREVSKNVSITSLPSDDSVEAVTSPIVRPRSKALDGHEATPVPVSAIKPEVTTSKPNLTRSFRQYDYQEPSAPKIPVSVTQSNGFLNRKTNYSKRSRERTRFPHRSISREEVRFARTREALGPRGKRQAQELIDKIKQARKVTLLGLYEPNEITGSSPQDLSHERFSVGRALSVLELWRAYGVDVSKVTILHHHPGRSGRLVEVSIYG
jgi:hypothetical protein